MKSKFILAAAAAVIMLAPLQQEAQAQEAQARSLSELLQLVEQGRARDSEELRRREQEFEAQRPSRSACCARPVSASAPWSRRARAGGQVRAERARDRHAQPAAQ
jgi:hypothetical protein